VVALNRAIAIGQSDGPAAGLAALDAIDDRPRLDRYPFYPAAVAEFELGVGRAAEARGHFLAAASLARNPAERRFFTKRADEARGAIITVSTPSPVPSSESAGG
jgi:RNA polymerase sigma-70 factor (ECF subfamily)